MGFFRRSKLSSQEIEENKKINARIEVLQNRLKEIFKEISIVNAKCDRITAKINEINKLQGEITNVFCGSNSQLQKDEVRQGVKGFFNTLPGLYEEKFNAKQRYKILKEKWSEIGKEISDLKKQLHK